MPFGLNSPSVDSVRLATPDDLPRIATVAAAGFFHSPTFQFQRVHYEKFPNDTLLSYLESYHAELQDPASIVIVAEDTLGECNEGTKVYQALQQASSYRPSSGPPGAKVIVGVASISLRPGSCYIGRFHTRSKPVSSGQ
jgi:hypothetical protein